MTEERKAEVSRRHKKHKKTFMSKYCKHYAEGYFQAKEVFNLE